MEIAYYVCVLGPVALYHICQQGFSAVLHANSVQQCRCPEANLIRRRRLSISTAGQWVHVYESNEASKLNVFM